MTTHTTLGRTGVVVSRIALGTMNVGGRTDVGTAHDMLDRALDAGVNIVDTANVYGHDPAHPANGRGRSEEIVGSWLRSRRRDEVVLATKMHFPMSDRPGALGSSARNIVRECEASLRRLGTDHVDLYQLHHPSNDVPVDESLRALDHLVRSGKVRYVGTSSFAAWQLLEALWVADRHHLVPPATEQPVLNLLERRIERELLPMARTYGLGVLTWSPLAGGLLAGRYERRRPPPPGSRHADFWRGRHEDVDDGVFHVLDDLTALASDVGVSLAVLSYRWALTVPGVSSVIVGPRTPDHLDVALDAWADGPLEGDVLARIDEIVPPGRVSFPQYGHDGLTWVPWGPHRYAVR